MPRARRTSTSSSPFRSEFERSVAASLSDRSRAYQYEATRLTYEVERTYTPDFRLRKMKESGYILVETKGYLKPTDRTKLLAVRRCNPLVDLRLVFQRASNKLNARSKMTYGEWATKHGFKWAEGTVPDAWLDE